MNQDLAWVDVEHMLEVLEVRHLTKATANEFRFSCPYPNHASGDEKPSCYMNADTTAFFCHGCHEKGNAVTLTAYMLAVSPLEAARLLREKYLPGGINPDVRDIEAEIQKILHPPPEQQLKQPAIHEDFLDKMLVDWHKTFQWHNRQLIPRGFSYMLDRGFTPETLEDWEIGFDVISDRPVITVRDERGTLIGFKARAHSDYQKPKYLILGDKPDKPEMYGFPCYYPSQVVFGAHRVKKGEPLIICEGELNAIAVHQKTGRQAVAINGSYFSDFHAKVILDLTDEVILMLDCDKAGDEAVWGHFDQYDVHHPGIVDRLSPFIDVNVCPVHQGDAVEMMPSEVEWCVSSAEDWVLNYCGF